MKRCRTNICIPLHAPCKELISLQRLHTVVCRNLLESGFQFTVDTISEASLVVGHEQECNDVRQELYVIKRIVSDGTELVTDAQHLRENETIVQT